MSDSVRPRRWQPTRLRCPWDSPGKNTGVGCHFLLQCIKVKRESEVTQSCQTQRPHGLQPTRLLRPWDFPSKSTGVGCHCLLRRQVHSLPDRKPSMGNMQTVKWNHSRSGRTVAQSFFASFFPSFFSSFLSFFFLFLFPLSSSLSLPDSFPSFLSFFLTLPYLCLLILTLAPFLNFLSLFRQSGHYFSSFDSIPEKKQLASSIQDPFFPGRKAWSSSVKQ